MTAPINPPIIAKASLVTARAIDKGFAVPMSMTNGALAVAGSSHSALGAINAAAAEGYHALVPRGPAKLLEKLFAKVDQSIVGSAAQAKQATTVFWAPFSEASIKTGSAVSNPFALFYADRAGFTLPDDPAAAQALLTAVKHPDPYVRWPTAQPEEAPPAEGGKTPPPADGGDTPPADGSKTPPPADGGDTPPPAEGDPAPPPADGGTTPPPAEGGDTPPPTEGDPTPPPADDSAPKPTSEDAPTSGDAAPGSTPAGDAGTTGAGPTSTPPADEQVVVGSPAGGTGVVAEEAPAGATAPATPAAAAAPAGAPAAVADATAGASAVPPAASDAAPAA